MGILSFVKTAFDPSRWIRGGVSGYTMLGKEARPQPFTYKSATAAYNSWVYAAANLNAQAVASVPLRLYVRNKTGGKALYNLKEPRRRTKAYLLGDVQHQPSPRVMRKIAEFGKDWKEVDDDHPLLRLLQQANPFNNGFDLTVLRILYGELTGNAYMHPIVSATLGVPVALYPMPSQWVEVVPCETNFIKGYTYGPTRHDRLFFPRDEVLHFRRPNPNDLYYGMGKLEAVWGAAQLNAANHIMDLALAQNHARPDYLAVFKGVATPEQLEQFRDVVNDQLRGVQQRGKFLTVNQDIDLKPLSFAPKDLLGRDDVVEEIAACFGVPVSMMKANDPNLASATAGYASWKQTTVLPLCRMDEEALNALLLPMFGIEEDAVLAYDNPVPVDRQFELTKHSSAIASGWMTVNEVREEQGLEPLPEPPPDAAPPPLPQIPAPPSNEQQAVEQEMKAKALSDVDLKPTAAMASAAERGLRLRKEHGKGGTAVGVARARDLKNRSTLSPSTVRRMHSFFSRHRGNEAGGEDDAGFIAFLLWGGAAGRSWAARKVEELERAERKRFTTKDCGTGEGGFKPGNTCGEEDGGGGDAGSLSTRARKMVDEAPLETKQAAKWRKEAEKAYQDDADFKAFADGAAFFTQGGFDEMQEAARQMNQGESPESHAATLDAFKHPLAEYKPILKGQELETTTMRDAVKAVRAAIADSQPTKQPIFRGMKMPRDESRNNAFGQFLATAKEGDEFSFDVPTSFSAERTVAEEFAQGIGGKKGPQRARARANPDDGILIVVAEGAKAASVAPLSPWKQQELLSEGKFKIKSIEGDRPTTYEWNDINYTTGEERKRLTYGWSGRDGGVRMVITLEPA